MDADAATTTRAAGPARQTGSLEAASAFLRAAGLIIDAVTARAAPSSSGGWTSPMSQAGSSPTARSACRTAPAGKQSQSASTAKSSSARRPGSATTSISVILPFTKVRPSATESWPRGATMTPTAPLTSASLAY